eukprot:Blabericola_migrator_1__11205@NODE_657_length_7016_cov_177_727587_g481_i0_p6_GENE_NODE_657_length_7016_cov_177_727587_g481_i0NODE_657_length_7016_cov_177_727587_g481_i0_p6_ORF_typecomplete_len128_score4_58_NODE_657_length_7016_cov_177_727587_g481_i039944377
MWKQGGVTQLGRSEERAPLVHGRRRVKTTRTIKTLKHKSLLDTRLAKPCIDVATNLLQLCYSLVCEKWPQVRPHLRYKTGEVKGWLGHLGGLIGVDTHFWHSLSQSFDPIGDHTVLGGNSQPCSKSQ